MDDNKFHFRIPKENVRIEKFDKTGFSPSVERLNHSEHGLKLKEQTNKLVVLEASRKDSKYVDELFVQIETPIDIPLKSQKLKIENLGFEILSYSPNNSSIGTAAIDKVKLNQFEERLNNYINSTDGSGKTYFSPIENIQPVSVESKIKGGIDFDSDTEIDVIINLYNTLTSKELLAINAVISEELKRFGRDVQQRNFANGISSISCKIKSKLIPSIASDFSSIREIKESNVFVVPQSIPADILPNPLNVERPLSDSTICIIDSGISQANGIMNEILYGQVQYLPPGSIECGFDHGTFVASRCVFGDQIDSCLGTHILKPYSHLLDISVFGRDSNGTLLGPNEFLLKSAIEDTVVNYYESIKVYNLSLGANTSIIDSEFSDTAKLMDFLSKKYKVLFVVAAGNIRSLLGSFPTDHFNSSLARICSPAESLLALTVGSIAKHADGNSLSPVNCVSPFSRIGPGADSGIKPEVVAHGGNCINPYSMSPRVSTYGISKDGTRLAYDVGTSHSAPLISQYAQRLFDLYPDCDPNLVKALLCHFTNERSIHEEINEPCAKFIGFGEPDIQMAIRAGENNAAFIYEGLLDQENYQIISFHVPKTLAEGQGSKLKIKITIVYDPPVSPDNQIEYSQSRISATLFKPNDQGMKAISVSPDDKYNLPWNPIIQFEKTFTRSYLVGKWDLRLRLFTRGVINENYTQDFAIVIELIDENGLTKVYSDIMEEFSNLYKKILIRIAA
jgi:hypothetical protein